MAVRINGSGEYLSRTTNLPSTTNFTMSGWALLTVRASQWQYFCGMDGDAGASWLDIGYTNTGVFELAATAQAGSPFGVDPAGAWFFYWIRCSGTGASDFEGGIYRPGIDTAFIKTNLAGKSFTPTGMWIGNDSLDEWCNGKYAATKVWNAVLTDAELYREMWTYIPQRHANLNLWSPHFPGASERIRDYGANGYDWTAGGTLSDEAGPPIPWGIAVPSFPPQGIAKFGDIVQSGYYEHGNAPTAFVTLDNAITEGNLLLACHFTGASNSIAPSGFNTAVDLIDATANLDAGAIYYKVAGASESTTITCTISGGSDEQHLLVLEVRGPFDATPLDQTSKSAEPVTASSVSTGTTGTIAQADEFAIALFTSRNPGRYFVPTNDFEKLYATNSGAKGAMSAFKVLTSQGTVETTGSQNLGALALMAGVATFRKALAGDKLPSKILRSARQDQSRLIAALQL
jgi:hypothetical protein